MKKRILIAVIILACGFTFKTDSQRQTYKLSKIKVAVVVECENKVIEKTIVENIRLAILRKGNIEYIKDFTSSEWEHLINIQAVELKYESGQTMDAIAMSVSNYERIPIEHFKPIHQSEYQTFPAIRLPSEQFIAYFPSHKVKDFCKATISTFMGWRKFHHNRKSSTPQ